MYEIDLEAFNHLSGEEQERITELLDQLSVLATENPLRHWYPHDKQKEFLASDARFKWMLGGNQSGKTTVCCVDDLIQAVDREALPPHLRLYKKHDPPFKWRVVGPDFDIVEMVVMQAELTKCLNDTGRNLSSSPLCGLFTSSTSPWIKPLVDWTNHVTYVNPNGTAAPSPV